MRKKLKNVRTLRFGLRFQFSIVLILATVLTTTTITYIIFKKNEQSILSEITRFSGAILKGAKRNAKRYLYFDREIRNSIYTDISNQLKRNYRSQRIEEIDEIQQYFPSIISKESILDHAFLINITDTTDWLTSEKNRYIYFRRDRPGIDEYSKKDPILNQLLNYYMLNIDTDIHMNFVENIQQEDKESNTLSDEDGAEPVEDLKDIVAVGLPIFSGDKTEELYQSYNDFIDSFLTAQSRNMVTEEIQEKRDDYEQQFIERLVYNYTEYDYLIEPASDEQYEELYVYFNGVRFTGRLTRDQRTFLKDEFLAEIKARGLALSYLSYKQICDTYRRKYNLSERYSDLKNWNGFYRYLNNKEISVSASEPLEELALLAYRSDLNGILGLKLLTSEFYTNLDVNRTEVFNISLAIFLRLIFIALLLPTFIIRKINKVAEGAYEIGRGNFDYRMDIKGYDEMGRLADIFNIMAKNLKRAREEMIEKNRMSDELQTAQAIQSVLLPDELPETAGFKFSAYYSAQTEAGGDYYDFIQLSEKKLGLTVADVSGHGVGSGLVMTMTRTLLHSFCKQEANPKKLMSMLNDHLYRNTAPKYFVTMFYGVLSTDTKKLSFSSAGHNPSIIVRKKSVKELPSGGIALGAVSNDTFDKHITTKSIQLEKGDYFVQYSDGIVEAMNPLDEEYGEDRFIAQLIAHAGKGPEAMKDAVVKDLRSFTKNSKQHDDITMIIMEVL
jgi:serine phosphatase RsbU (regulator of sigma subunit)